MRSFGCVLKQKQKALHCRSNQQSQIKNDCQGCIKSPHSSSRGRTCWTTSPLRRGMRMVALGPPGGAGSTPLKGSPSSPADVPSELAGLSSAALGDNPATILPWPSMSSENALPILDLGVQEEPLVLLAKEGCKKNGIHSGSCRFKHFDSESKPRPSLQPLPWERSMSSFLRR